MELTTERVCVTETRLLALTDGLWPTYTSLKGVLFKSFGLLDEGELDLVGAD